MGYRISEDEILAGLAAEQVELVGTYVDVVTPVDVRCLRNLPDGSTCGTVRPVKVAAIRRKGYFCPECSSRNRISMADVAANLADVHVELVGEYEHVRAPMNVRCVRVLPDGSTCGEARTISLEKIRAGRFTCKKCNSGKATTLEQRHAQAYADMVALGYTPNPGVTFPGTNREWPSTCNTCGGPATPVLARLKNGIATSGCPTCSPNAALTAEEVDRRLAGLKHSMRLDDTWVNARHETWFVCTDPTCQSRERRRYDDLRKSDGCNRCALNIMNEQEAIQRANERALTPVGPFTGSTKPWLVQCRVCGDVVTTIPHQLRRQGAGCSCSTRGLQYDRPTLVYVSRRAKPRRLKVGLTNPDSVPSRRATLAEEGFTEEQTWVMPDGWTARRDVEAPALEWAIETWGAVRGSSDEFPGATETLSGKNLDLDALIAHVDQLVTDNGGEREAPTQRAARHKYDADLARGLVLIGKGTSYSQAAVATGVNSGDLYRYATYLGKIGARGRSEVPTDAIVAAYVAGTPIAVLSEKFTLPSDRIRKVLKAADVYDPARDRGGLHRRRAVRERDERAQGDIDQIVGRYNHGEPIYALAKEYRVDVKKLRRWMDASGLRDDQAHRDHRYAGEINIEAIVADRVAGMAIPQIAAKYQLDRTRVSKLLQASGLHTKGTRVDHNEPDIDAVVADYKAGMSIAALSKKFGYYSTGISRLLRDAGVDTTRKRTRKSSG